MKRTLGQIFGYTARTSVCLLITSAAFGQAQEQHWQATPNYPSNYGPNYQPPAPPAGSNPSAAAPNAGQYPNHQAPNQQAQQPYPTIERRDGSQPAQPQYGPPAAVDNRQYPQNSSAPGQNMQGPPAQGLMQAGPNQSGLIQGPPIQGPPARPTAPRVPFVLSQPEINALENLLTDWEKRNREIHVMESKFVRWKYDSVFPTPGQAPPPPDDGELKFASPDKAWMKITCKDTKHPEQNEQWLCDGRSVFQWDYQKKEVHEWIMPPEMQGKGIGDGPLPFVFGIEAQKLKQRYFMRIITPPSVQNEVWLEAYPKFQQDASNYSKVEVILQVAGEGRALFPFAIQIYSPNGKDRIVYQLQNPIINPRVLVPVFFGDWTKPSIDFGWKKVTELPRTAAPQSGMNAAAMQR